MKENASERELSKFPKSGGSFLYGSGRSICSEGETRCSAVWSAHLFWVQRAIGSNPVTLM